MKEPLCSKALLSKTAVVLSCFPGSPTAPRAAGRDLEAKTGPKYCTTARCVILFVAKHCLSLLLNSYEEKQNSITQDLSGDSFLPPLPAPQGNQNLRILYILEHFS